jgi:hypothetical protein
MGTDSTLHQTLGDGCAAQESTRLSEQPGTRIGHYKLLEQIGEGGLDGFLCLATAAYRYREFHPGLACAQPGRTIGRYVIHYADGQTAEVPLLAGRTIQDWWSDPATLESPGEAEVAWVGTKARTQQVNRTIHLLGITWTNPRPGVSITSIDFEQAGADFRPFRVAVTAE